MLRSGIIAAILSLAAATAHAGQYEDARDEAYFDAMVISGIKKDVSPCAVIGSQVAQIMANRLQGEAMSVQMARPDFKFFGYVIRDAYKQPFYETAEAQGQLMRAFRERYEVECYDVLGERG